MPTTIAKLDQLCTSTIGLSSGVDDLGTSPRKPFESSDKKPLNAKALQLANEYIRLANLKANKVDDGAVDSALHSVAAAQAMIDVINNQPSNTLSAAGVMTGVDVALEDVAKVV